MTVTKNTTKLSWVRTYQWEVFVNGSHCPVAMAGLRIEAEGKGVMVLKRAISELDGWRRLILREASAFPDIDAKARADVRLQSKVEHTQGRQAVVFHLPDARAVGYWLEPSTGRPLKMVRDTGPDAEESTLIYRPEPRDGEPGVNNFSDCITFECLELHGQVRLS